MCTERLSRTSEENSLPVVIAADNMSLAVTYRVPHTQNNHPQNNRQKKLQV